MLRTLRTIGYLAPVPVALLTVVAFSGLPGVDPRQRLLLAAVGALAAAGGGTLTALVCWGLFGWRLDRLAEALEGTVDANRPVQLRVAGTRIERRLAEAFNAAIGRFVQVEARATHDRLTGVANRETLLTVLGSEVERATRHQKWLSLAFIDIDRFKPINDTFGHHAGDAVLCHIAALIRGSIRASDLFGRYGGEEFMLILPETTPDEAAVLAEQLRTLVAENPPLITPTQPLRVTISIGVAGELGAELQADRLIDRADSAMYQAKSLGRNRTNRFQEVDEEGPIRRAPISAERRAAATAIGQWASDTAAEALASVLAPLPSHRGQPSDLIASLATGIARELGLPHEEIERIRIASLLHDLGKLAVPPEVLDKPTALSNVDWQAIGEHPRIGQVILEQATSLREAIPAVLHHHERYNGAGYPHGLRGNEIPLAARIVAVADAYHAMTHERPHEAARSHSDALREIRAGAGTQFDPAIVELFCRIFADGVPADGLDEVYALHQRARGRMPPIRPPDAAAVLGLHGGQGLSVRDGRPRPAGKRRPTPAGRAAPHETPADKAAG